jgi:hypothetical protein
MAVGRLLRKVGFWSAVGTALLLWGSGRGLAGPEDCPGSCEPACCPVPPRRHHRLCPRVRVKTGCKKPKCDPCLMPHAGYYPTCWEARPWGLEHSRCVPPPSESIPEGTIGEGAPGTAPTRMPRAEELPLPTKNPGATPMPMPGSNPRPNGMGRLPSRLQGRMPSLAGWLRHVSERPASPPFAPPAVPPGLPIPPHAGDWQ